jgi:uncharacterized protein YecE (DUF72 family)
MQNKDLIIIALVIAIIYLYYQSRKLAQLPATSQTIFVAGENQEDLIAEKDQAIRDKNETEQELISVSNKLKLKIQEVSRKDTEIRRITELLNKSETQITRLKDEKSKVEIALNSKIKEWKKKAEEQGKITTTLNQEKLKLQEKYDKKVAELETKQEIIKQHQEQLRQIYALFDLRTQGMKEIEFSQLITLLQKVRKKTDLSKIHK